LKARPVRNSWRPKVGTCARRDCHTSPPSMSSNQRIAIVVAALAVAVLAFLIARPGDDEEPERSAGTTQTQNDPQTETGDDSAEPQPTTETEPAPPPKPKVTRLKITGGVVAGEAKTIEVSRGDTVRIVVTADASDEIHLHGYDITRTAAPGQPARFRFKANAEGAFEIESHVAADAGLDALVARLVVSPS
jgi:FtsP/CotA-like multicopper oxidase with cupredoxin domain